MQIRHPQGFSIPRQQRIMENDVLVELFDLMADLHSARVTQPLAAITPTLSYPTESS